MNTVIAVGEVRACVVVKHGVKKDESTCTLLLVEASAQTDLCCSLPARLKQGLWSPGHERAEASCHNNPILFLAFQ